MENGHCVSTTNLPCEDGYETIQKKLKFAIHGEPGLRVGRAWIVLIWCVILLCLDLFHLLLSLILSFLDTIEESRRHWNMLVIAGHRVNGGGDPRFIHAC